ncbi:hypothetical protein HY968_04990 [Candidatus Kaiserbacteria bacterium]|nr:hypothetical protein [Candidatus Kaiserbacteria bacterium]
MIETHMPLREDTRLLQAEQDAKLQRAKFLAGKAVTVFGKLDKGSEHYGLRYGEVLRDLACAYRLAYESADQKADKQDANTRRTKAVMHQIEIFCQEQSFALKQEEITLPGLETIDVRIDSSLQE